MRDSIDFSRDPVRKVFVKMFLPTLIGMVSMVVLNITDGAFVGHGVGSDALAAVNIVAPIFMISGAVGLMFGIGSSVVASIHLAKGNQHAANINITQGIIASFTTGILIALLTSFFPVHTCRLFGCSEPLIPLACSYLRWVSLLTPFNLVGMTGMFAVRLDGHPRFAMTMNCSMAIANIILDWLLIYGFRIDIPHTDISFLNLHLAIVDSNFELLPKGLEGAAIATFTAFGLGNIPLLWFLLTRTKTIHLTPLRLTLTSLRLTLRNLLYQTKIGLSAFIGEMAIASVMIIGNYVFIHYLGEDGVAAFSVACYCLPIVFMMGNAIVQSIQPVISFAHGQQNQQRLNEALRVAIITSLLTGIAGMIIMSLGAPIITSVFLPNGCNAYTLCLQGLPLYSPAFLFIAVNIVIVGYLQSIEAATRATIVTLLRGFIFSIPAFLLLPTIVSPQGLWLALPVAECATLILIILYNLGCRGRLLLP